MTTREGVEGCGSQIVIIREKSGQASEGVGDFPSA